MCSPWAHSWSACEGPFGKKKQVIKHNKKKWGPTQQSQSTWREAFGKGTTWATVVISRWWRFWDHMIFTKNSKRSGMKPAWAYRASSTCCGGQTWGNVIVQGLQNENTTSESKALLIELRNCLIVMDFRFPFDLIVTVPCSFPFEIRRLVCGCIFF